MTLKRLLDIIISVCLLVVLSPLVAVLALAIWLSDRQNPLYTAERIGLGGRAFRMMKFRSMVVGADSTGVDSTASDDARLTTIGKFLRRYKLDEIPQVLNVLRGEMSLVGPRPNVERETRMYSEEERRLLDVRPGITDLASIVFADEGEILEGAHEPDIAYNQLIRPWKSRLGLFYVDNRSLTLDLQVLRLTATALVDRQAALKGIVALLVSYGASPDLVRAAERSEQLEPQPPPGFDDIVRKRG